MNDRIRESDVYRDEPTIKIVTTLRVGLYELEIRKPVLPGITRWQTLIDKSDNLYDLFFPNPHPIE